MFRIGRSISLMAAASAALFGFSGGQVPRREMRPTRGAQAVRFKDLMHEWCQAQKSWKKVRAGRIANVLRKRRERKRGRKTREYLRWWSSR